MKLIKKIAAIMFAFMMVFSLSTNAKAEESGVNKSQGSITITNARANEGYSIYRILDLDSYNSTTGNYSYTYRTEGEQAEAWKKFIEDNTGEGKYFKLTDGKYITANATAKGEDIAKAALKFVKDNHIRYEISKMSSVDKNIKFENLPLGYYLVESSVTTVCSLDTAIPNQEIIEKTSDPTVTKTIIRNEGPVSMTSANIGDIITYQVEITAGKGAKNYVFHDNLENGLKYCGANDSQPFTVGAYTDQMIKSENGQTTSLRVDKENDYTLTFDNPEETAFTLRFKDTFTQKLEENTKITLMYHAIVTKNAPMDVAIKNKAFLNYGAKQETVHSITSVYTYQIPVLKYTTKDDAEIHLAGAHFNLYKNEKNSNNLVKFDAKDSDAYTYNENGKVTELVSDDDGMININGLSAGKYVLDETQAPHGYNKLISPIIITVSQNTDGTKKIVVGNSNKPTNIVKVLNNSGKILPSTGGMGTTLIYLIGGALVLGSGFVLANKKRAKAK